MDSIVKTSLFLLIIVLTGCANNSMRTPEPLDEGQTDREFITLRTGQICEVKGTKLVACERNTYRYAENKADLRQMEVIENALAEQEENE